MSKDDISLIGSYGQWAASLVEEGLPDFSYKREKWKGLGSWRKAAKKGIYSAIVDSRWLRVCRIATGGGAWANIWISALHICPAGKAG